MDNQMDPQAEQQTNEAYLKQLRTTFQKLPHDIPIYMFVDEGRDDVFAQTNRQIIRAFRELSDRITFREYTTAHEKAREWEVEGSPTLVIAPALPLQHTVKPAL